MGSAPVRRETDTKIASQVRRGASTTGPGSYRVRRPSGNGPAEAGIEVWEQASEPLAAAIHDFWYDTDAVA